jgi:hypothetical protein
MTEPVRRNRCWSTCSADSRSLFRGSVRHFVSSVRDRRDQAAGAFVRFVLQRPMLRGQWPSDVLGDTDTRAAWLSKAAWGSPVHRPDTHANWGTTAGCT